DRAGKYLSAYGPRSPRRGVPPQEHPRAVSAGRGAPSSGTACCGPRRAGGRPRLPAACREAEHLAVSISIRGRSSPAQAPRAFHPRNTRGPRPRGPPGPPCEVRRRPPRGPPARRVCAYSRRKGLGQSVPGRNWTWTCFPTPTQTEVQGSRA
ncbi:MAG: hypothetical protein ACK559_33445, partial [bacterium]